MSLYLSDAMKAVCNQISSDSADVWEYPITIIKFPDRAFAVTNPNQYNPGYRQQRAVQQNYTPVSGSFMGRIWWRQPNINDLDVDDSMKEDLPKTFCRLKLRADGYNFLTGVNSIEIQGINTNPDWLSPRPHNMFLIDGGQPQFYDIICNLSN